MASRRGLQLGYRVSRNCTASSALRQAYRTFSTVSIQATAPPRRSPWQRASSDTSCPRSTSAEDCQVFYSQLHGYSSPAPIPRRVRQVNATTTPESFQAPTFLDRSIRCRLWPTGTTTRKSQLSPATRNRVRTDRSNRPHCPACSDTPQAQAGRGPMRSGRFRITAHTRFGPQGRAVASIPLAVPSGIMSAPMLAATRAADACTESRARWA